MAAGLVAGRPALPHPRSGRNPIGPPGKTAAVPQGQAGCLLAIKTAPFVHEAVAPQGKTGSPALKQRLSSMRQQRRKE